MQFIYVLRLEDDHFYIGRVQQRRLRDRIEEHRNGRGSIWTRLHKVVATEVVKPMANMFDEDNTTKEYMHIYGIDRVRGGSYVMRDLPDFQINALEIELRSTQDVCWGCGCIGHYVRECIGYNLDDQPTAAFIVDSDVQN